MEEKMDKNKTFIIKKNKKLIGIVIWCALNQHRPGRKTLSTIAASGLYR